MVRYGADYLNAGYEANNQGKPAPNAPYLRNSLLPVPCSLFPVPCSLFPAP
ncbi:hypothetical protein [Moorena producens]|uniref:hypothetical protein n=1 Tax=Moorena producens TaxID=1155739 RepID=UPI000AEDC08D|nr:hypothetical protein [Moorena producens]